MTEKRSEEAIPAGRLRPPSLPQQAWNLARALADFVADGCHTVGEEEYRQRLEICDSCEQRRENRCMKCGCRLSVKARGRAFRCPLGKWPALDDSLPNKHARCEATARVPEGSDQ